MSAALDFIDEVKMMTDVNHVILAGKQTKADRLYMDVRAENLPGKEGIFIFPIKVYHNRPRGDNEPYKPDIELENMTDLQDILSALRARL